MERRVKDRTETSVQLTCRAPARPCRAIMHDVSHTGCRLEVPEGNLELGGTALIDLPGAVQVTGRVMWVRGNQAGIRFDRPLRGPAAMALGLPETETVAAEPLGREGTRRRGLVADRLSQLTDPRY